MAIEKVQSGSGQDKFAQLYSKYNATVDALEAGTSGQVLQGTTPGGDPVWSTPPTVGIKFLPPIDIGNWNMDTTTNVSVAHGVVDFTKIRCIHVTIRNDAGTKNYDLVRSYISSTTNIGGSTDGWDATYVYLLRTTGGIFDSTDFNLTPYNRGFITIGVID